MKPIVQFAIASILVISSLVLACLTLLHVTSVSEPGKEPVHLAGAAGLETSEANSNSSASLAQALQTPGSTLVATGKMATTPIGLAQIDARPRATDPTTDTMATKTSTPAPAPQDQPVAASVVRGTSAAPIPILMYHYIRINPNPKDQIGFGLSVTPTDFEAQMNHMARLGFRTISLADLDNPANHDGKAFVITFDDGYTDAYEVAYPILQRYGFKGVFYIITGLVGYPSFMNWAQIEELASKGMIIGSHSVNHPDLSSLDTIKLQSELTNSKTTLEKNTGHIVNDLCYPSGLFDAKVATAARQAGYLTAVTTRGGLYHPDKDHMALSRVRISGGMTLPEFASVATPGQKPQ